MAERQFPLINLKALESDYIPIDFYEINPVSSDERREWNIQAGTEISQLREQIIKEIGIDTLIALNNQEITLNDLPEELRDTLVNDLTTLRNWAEEMAYQNRGLIKKAISLFSINIEDENDLWQIGWISLVQSAQRYNPTENDNQTNFYSYAIRSLRGEFLNWYAQTTGMRKYEISHFYKYQKAQKQLEENYEDRVTHEKVVAMALANRVNSSLTFKEYWTKIQNLRKKQHLSKEDLDFLNRQRQEEVYYWILINAIKEHQNSLVVNYTNFYSEPNYNNIPVEDLVLSQEPSPEDFIALQEFYTNLQELMNSVLNNQELQIVQLRYGLNGNEPLTLQETGQLFNLSAERIRAIQARALRKLRQPHRNRLLKEYYSDNNLF